MLAGLIFGAIAIAWIVYLVPYILARREQDFPLDQNVIDQFAESMQLVRRGGEPAPGYLIDSGAEVSTPLTRRAARHNFRQASRIARQRRRRGLILNLLLLAAGVVLPFVLPISRWWTALPAALLIGWLVLSRISVVTLERMLAAVRAQIEFGDEEQTIVIGEHSEDETVALVTETERSVEITGPSSDTLGSLWDPIPVTPTTYVSRPLLPRSVRTIDLSAPVASSELRPVIAERPAEQVSDEDDLPRAVGE